ncbi:glycerophosphodiester phosphodiesterase [Wenjunlia vitaminophila]|uniref:Glycerophosphodiester phosphodiesterase n=1 Tax=Wenjunlia vitaminophila TaxID=76728 RepID=A0A0T6LUZ7_WENVI|nr:glycerophosphodiester phosphodiesterase [Wenjunlia vitaminophila]KRV49877.1 glycerophosphodiester phosphodiesterase [Wenjunlia vitaminophila]
MSTRPRSLAVAHRGDPYRYRENTLPSLLSAWRAGADAVEVDVRTTADGVPVLLHDSTLERLWGMTAPVARTSSDEVRRIGVPTLREALATLPCRTLIDLSDPGSARAAVAEAHACGAGDRVYYCGGFASMAAVREADPATEIALTWNRAAPPPDHLLRWLRPRWLNLPFGLVNQALVDRVHGLGLRCGVWTVDRPRTMTRLVGLGVDAITTNRIAALRGLIGPPH